MEQDDPRLVFVKRERATTPIDGGTVLANRWWCFVEGRGVLFYRPTPKAKHLAPQCNWSQDIAERICERLYPWATVEYFPVVYVQAD